MNNINIVRCKEGVVNGETIKSFGKMYLKQNESCTIKITNYFVRRFVKENDVFYKTLHGEVKSRSVDVIPEFFTVYNQLIKDYAECDIFNMDETALFIKNIGNRSYVTHKDDTKSIKLNKVRITLGITLNKLNEQLPPLIIGKSANPRCFKNINLKSLGVFYRANKTAWLTQLIFREYLEFINNIMISQNRKILLLIDNAPGHKISSLSNIKLVELPPNTTALMQPLDQGIIKSFKNYYRNKLNDFLVSKLVVPNIDFKHACQNLNLLDVVYWIKDSLSKVSEITVFNCWGVFERIRNEKGTSCADKICFESNTEESINFDHEI